MILVDKWNIVNYVNNGTPFTEVWENKGAHCACFPKRPISENYFFKKILVIEIKDSIINK